MQYTKRLTCSLARPMPSFSRIPFSALHTPMVVMGLREKLVTCAASSAAIRSCTRRRLHASGLQCSSAQHWNLLARALLPSNPVCCLQCRSRAAPLLAMPDIKRQSLASAECHLPRSAAVRPQPGAPTRKQAKVREPQGAAEGRALHQPTPYEAPGRSRLPR